MRSELLKRLSEKPIADFICPYQHSGGIMLGSSDVGDVSHIVPTAQFMAACAVPGTPGRSWQRAAQGKSSLALKGMMFAARVLSGADQALYEDSELVQEAKREFQKATGSRPYHCLIPDDVLPNQHGRSKK